MDPNRIIQALKGTIDPNLRIAAENELNQVGESEEMVLVDRDIRTFTHRDSKLDGDVVGRSSS